MTEGLSTRLTDTILTQRASELLANGPADAVVLIEHVCRMPGAPRVVAEQMAMALFADRAEFVRDASGRWTMALGRGTEVRGTEVRGTEVRGTEVRGTEVRGDSARDELATLSYAVVDVETTGMRAWGGDRVTEVAAVVVRNGRIADRFSTLINPERPIPAMITALTHIDARMVRHAPRFGDVCDELFRMLDGHVFVAHNAEFDWRFLSAELARARGRRLVGRRLCTVRLARRVLPYLRSRRLDSLARYYNITITDRHRAAGDAQATAHVLLHLLDAARDRECRCWADLERLAGARPSYRRRGRGVGRPSALPHSADGESPA